MNACNPIRLLGKHVLSKDAPSDFLTSPINFELSGMQCIVLSGIQIYNIKHINSTLTLSDENLPETYYM